MKAIKLMTPANRFPKRLPRPERLESEDALPASSVAT
jgi:hypothetical protein